MSKKMNHNFKIILHSFMIISLFAGIFSCSFGDADALDALYSSGDRLYVTHESTSVYVSEDLEVWTSVGIPQGFSSSVIYSEGIFVIGGQNAGPGSFVTSSDGYNWSVPLVPVGSPSLINGLANGNGIFVGVTSNGQACTSGNGLSWETTIINLGNDINDVCYGNDRFVAVGTDSIYTSTDGLSWSGDIWPYATIFYGVTNGQNIFVAVGQGAGLSYISVSSNGTSWSTNMLTTGLGNIINDVTYGGRKFVAVGDGGYIFVSEDGYSWDQLYVPASNGFSLRSVIYSELEYIAVGGNGTVITSNDGHTWTRMTSFTAGQLESITVSP